MKDHSCHSLRCLRADVSYFLRCTRATKEIGDVCTQTTPCAPFTATYLSPVPYLPSLSNALP